MRVLVTWANEGTTNLGVRALARGSSDLLRKVWEDVDITFANYGERPPELPWGRPRSLLRERVTRSLGMMDWFRQFDLVWDTRSGDSFADIYGMERHATMSLVHEFAVQAGVPVVLAPQTIGPFHTSLGRVVARRSLRRSTLAFARDAVSATASARLGRPADAVSSDLVFAIQQPEPGVRRDVLLNVSGLLWRDNPHVDSAMYRSAVRSIVARLLSDGRGVTLFPHVLDSAHHDNDLPTCMELADEYDGAVDVFSPSDLDDARAAISAAELVIGARMHACLNALSVATPAVAMAYSRKFEPLLNSVGWPHVTSLMKAADARDVADQVLAAARSDYLKERALEARAEGIRMLAPVVDRLEALR